MVYGWNPHPRGAPNLVKTEVIKCYHDVNVIFFDVIFLLFCLGVVAKSRFESKRI